MHKTVDSRLKLCVHAVIALHINYDCCSGGESSTVLKYNFEILYLSISIFCYFFTSTPLHFSGKYCTFYSIAFLNIFLYKLSYFADSN